jgi:hypothetical protein
VSDAVAYQSIVMLFLEGEKKEANADVEAASSINLRSES